MAASFLIKQRWYCVMCNLHPKIFFPLLNSQWVF